MKDGRRLGARPAPYSAPQQPSGQINVTDPDSRLLKAPGGYVQGDNAQVVTNENQIVIAAEVNVDSPDVGARTRSSSAIADWPSLGASRESA
jgi:hypothetical protein